MAEDDPSEMDKNKKVDDDKMTLEQALSKIESDGAEMVKMKETIKKTNDEGLKLRLKFKELENNSDSDDKKKLEEQNKYKELYEKSEAKQRSNDDKLKIMTINSELKAIAAKEGIKDISLISLVDKESLVFDEDNLKVHGAKEAIEELKTSKPFLFGKEEEKKTNPKDSKLKTDNDEGEVTPQQMIEKGWNKEQILQHFLDKREANKKNKKVIGKVVSRNDL